MLNWLITAVITTAIVSSLLWVLSNKSYKDFLFPYHEFITYTVGTKYIRMKYDPGLLAFPQFTLSPTGALV